MTASPPEVPPRSDPASDGPPRTDPASDGPPRSDPARSGPARYDPWHDLAVNWPEIEVVIQPMSGRLLGVLRYPVIALRAGTSAAQRRCTLAHELVHLERGVGDCGQWNAREELLVHREVARRLIPFADLASAVRLLGDSAALAELARALDVDSETARLRLDLLTRDELDRLCRSEPDAGWPSA